MDLPLISSSQVKGKKVIVRCDFDVPIEDGQILDDSRLISGISTIEYLLEEGAEVVAIGHLGRPESNEKSFSLLPVARWFSEEFSVPQPQETKVGEFDGWIIKQNFTMLENLRFFKGEEENDPEFLRSLVNLGEIYVNEAFGSSHREHASIV